MTESPTTLPLSVVIPVRNGMPFIKEAVASVLDDPRAPHLELIIRENGSTDGTQEWLETLSDPRVRVEVAESPGSAAENWTAVSRLARGEWVKLLCADDYVEPGGLARQLRAARSGGGVSLVASRRAIVDGEGRRLIRARGLGGLRGKQRGSLASRRAILSGVNPFGEPSSVLIRRDALLAALPWDATFPYLIDLDLYVRVLQQGDMVGLPSVDAVFRVSDASWSAEIGRAQYADFRGWIHAQHRTAHRLTRIEFVVAEIMCLGMYLARRAVSRSIYSRRRRIPLRA